MIAKIVTGKSFGGAVRYMMEKSGHARIIDSDGVELSDIRSLIGSFNFQRKARPEKTEVVGHISLSFHKDDKPKAHGRIYGRPCTRIYAAYGDHRHAVHRGAAYRHGASPSAYPLQPGKVRYETGCGAITKGSGA